MLKFNITNIPCYIEAQGINIKNEIKTIKKKGNSPLQPLYESFMNSWEALDDANMQTGKIEISLYLDKASLLEEEKDEFDFIRLEIKDNGSGLNDESLNRLYELRNDTKNKSNFGTGRVQYIHRFDSTIIKSIYGGPQNARYREIELSKRQIFLDNNSIIKMLDDQVVGEHKNETTTIFEKPLRDDIKVYYSKLSAGEIKKRIVIYFFPLLTSYREKLPNISIFSYRDGKLSESETISMNDLPKADKESDFKVSYKSKNKDGQIVVLNEQEKFKLHSFVFDKKTISENKAFFVSKGTLAKSMPISCIEPNTAIDGNRYLFIVSGDFITNSDSDNRGDLKILSDNQLKQLPTADALDEKYITIEDISNATDKQLCSLYESINNLEEQSAERLTNIKNLFCISDEIVDECRQLIKSSDNDESILNKLYQAEKEKQVKFDANIKHQLDKLQSISPSEAGYLDKMAQIANDIAAKTPLQNKNTLSRYVARRNIALNLFQKIVEGTHETCQGDSKPVESVLHDLFFRRKQQTPYENDLWLLNEEFIYYPAFSDLPLKDIMYKNKNLFYPQIEEEEKKIILTHKDKYKRPDIVLFPEEGKCILIEFKAPHVDVSEYLNQLNKYASIIAKCSRDDAFIKQCFGYLIGENVDPIEVQQTDGLYTEAESLGYLFKPNTTLKLFGPNSHKEAYLYTEVHKYSTILNRALKRNSIFLQKLGLLKEGKDVGASKYAMKDLPGAAN